MSEEHTTAEQNMPDSRQDGSRNDVSCPSKAKKNERWNLFIAILVLAGAGAVLAHAVLTKNHCGRGAGLYGGCPASTACAYDNCSKGTCSSSQKSRCLEPADQRPGSDCCRAHFADNKTGVTCPNRAASFCPYKQ